MHLSCVSMKFIGLEQLGRPGKVLDLFRIAGVAIACNIAFLAVALATFGLFASAAAVGLRTGVVLGFLVGLVSSVSLSLRHGIVADWKANASVGTFPVSR